MENLPLDIKDLIIFFMSLFFYLFYKSFLNLKNEIIKVKNDAIYDINILSDKLNRAINKSDYFLEKKKRYLIFCLENPHLTEKEFIQALLKQGFSEEELEIIRGN